MYCSSCGVEVTKELNYCNRCGANLNAAASLAPQVYAPPVKLTGPIVALGATVILSLIVIFAAADKLSVRGIHPTALAWIIIISLAVLLGIVGRVTQLMATLMKNSSNGAEEQRPPQLRNVQANEPLPAAQTGPMNAPLSSVTDHTTRTFEPAYRERRK
jgi:hypothetical protein